MKDKRMETRKEIHREYKERVKPFGERGYNSSPKIREA